MSYKNGISIPFTLSQPKFHLAKWIGKDVFVRPNIFWPTLTGREAKVKVKKELTEDKFDHVRCQESSWTRIFTVAEVQCVLVGCCELVFVCVSFLLSHSIVSESVKYFWVWYARVFLLVWLDSHERMCSLRDHCSVREDSLLKKSSLEAN